MQRSLWVCVDNVTEASRTEASVVEEARDAGHLDSCGEGGD